MKIIVTQKNIDQGNARGCNSCPIFLAIKNQCKTIGSVGAMGAHFHGSKTVWLPTTAIDFIDRFDRGLKVKPFEFELSIPES